MTWKPDYATVDFVRRFIDVDDNTEDEWLALYVSTVSRNIDKWTGRQFGKVAIAEERYYEPVYDRRDCCWYATIDDLQDTTGLIVKDDDGNTLDAADYRLEPRNAVREGVPYERLRITTSVTDLAVTALFGWNAQPAGVNTAMLLQCNRLSARRASAFGISGSPSTGGEIRLLAQLDVDAKTALQPLRRMWWAA